MNLCKKTPYFGGIMLKKTILSFLLTGLTALPFEPSPLSAQTLPEESTQVARVNFSFNVYSFGGCGCPCYNPCYNPYFFYPYPPCAYPCGPCPYWMW